MHLSILSACSLEQTALFFRQILILEKSLYSCIREKICNLLTNVINWGIKDFQEFMTGEFVIGFLNEKTYSTYDSLILMIIDGDTVEIVRNKK